MSESVLSLQPQSLLNIHSGDAKPRRSERKVRARLRALECVRGILEGKSYAQVAADLGYANRGTVHRIVQQTLARHEVVGIEELRALELARLDHIQSAFYEEAVGGNVKAAEVVLKVMAARCRLLQLDRLTGEDASGHASGDVVVVGGSTQNYIEALKAGHPQ